MTYPTKPDEAYDYVTWQASHPTEPLPAASVAADYAGHKSSIDALIEFLQVSLRSDGLLKSGTVTPQSLSTTTAALVGGFLPRGDWVTATAYAVGDVVETPSLSGSNYVCVTAHTSGTFATDRAAGKWQALTSIRLEDNLAFTGNNTHAGTETFNGAATFNQTVGFNQATTFANGVTATFNGATVFGASVTATFNGNVTFAGTGKTFSVGSGVTVDMGSATAVSVPTVAVGDGDTSAASTLFVQNEFATRYGRNVLINGDFAIDQRSEGASKTLTAGAAVAYTLDRWYASCTGANATVQQVAGTSPNPFALKFTGLASNTGVLLGQRIEAADAAPLASQTVYVSLQVKSSSLTSLTWTAYYANSADNFGAKTQIATGTISSISSTLASKSFSFAAGTGVANGLCIEFTGGALLGSQTLQIENVQLEVSQVTAFERRPISERLARCMRYYEKSYSIGTAPGTATSTSIFAGLVNSGGTFVISQPFRVVKRAAPTVTLYSNSSGTSGKLYDASGLADITASAAVVGTSNWYVNASGFTGSGIAQGHYAADAEL